MIRSNPEAVLNDVAKTSNLSKEALSVSEEALV